MRSIGGRPALPSCRSRRTPRSLASRRENRNACPFASRCITKPTIGTTGRSLWVRRSCGCGRRRTRARRFVSYSLQDRAGGPLSQLAAGSAGQLSGPDRVSRKGAALSRRGRSGRRDDGHQSVRFLSGAGGRDSIRSPTSRELLRDLAPFLMREEPGPLLASLARIGRSTRRCGPIDFLVASEPAAQPARSSISIRLEPGVQTPEETLRRGRGSCRDSAWLLVQILRHLGLAARFVSGYLIQLKPDEKPLEGPAGAEQDFTDLHAWCEVLSARRRLGWARSRPAACSPAKGTFRWRPRPTRCRPRRSAAALEPCEAEFEHVMRVSRIHEDPRVTKPYTDEQWSRIDALGRRRRSTSCERAGRAADDGGRADVRLDRRHGRRRVEHRGRRPQQATAVRDADPPAAQAICPGRPVALWPGQSGIPASSFRAGRWPATGARTAIRFGAIRR